MGEKGVHDLAHQEERVLDDVGDAGAVGLVVGEDEREDDGGGGGGGDGDFGRERVVGGVDEGENENT